MFPTEKREMHNGKAQNWARGGGGIKKGGVVTYQRGGFPVRNKESEEKKKGVDKAAPTGGVSYAWGRLGDSKG